jgi:DNA-binding winged helix-turn-helix (wHTH) protein/tetratricopeptide (TPR) repeat protein
MATPENAIGATVRFGLFEADFATGDLRRQGVHVKIQEQPLLILRALLEQPGRLVSREELRARVWQNDTFVDFDNGLNTSINKLRDALGDSADNPRYIQTVPRHGYRFIAPVSMDAGPPPHPVVPGSSDDVSVRTRHGPIVPIVVVLAMATAVGVVLGWRAMSSRTLTDKGTIVLADFTNNTGDPIFDGTLRQGLAVELEQSPFLNLLPESDVQRTLRLMRKPSDTPLTQDIAWEICQRNGTTIVLDGSIAQIGSQYELLLRAMSCADGRTVTSTEARAGDKNGVLEALNRASADIRQKLGESRASIQRFATPLAQASTSSLEALQFYSLGYQALVGKGDSAAAVPLFRNALAHDPNFAMAYALLGNSSWNLGETVVAAESIRKAYELRSTVSELERLRIDSEYHSFGTGDLENARLDFQVWAQTYPRDCSPRHQLGVVHLVLGQFEKALDAFEDALRLCPQSALIRSNLTYSYIALNRIRDARASAEQSRLINPDAPGLKINLYRLAFLDHDTRQMRDLAASSTGTAGLEDELLWQEAATASYSGEYERSKSLLFQATAAAHRIAEKETAANYNSVAALTAAQFGVTRDAEQLADAALTAAHGSDLEYRVGVTLSLLGNTRRAESIAQDLESRFPTDTLVQAVYVPTIRAQIALVRGDSAGGIKLLQAALPYELGAGLYPAYVRGLALDAAGRPADAVIEFTKITNNKGVVLNSPIGALAFLELGRAYAADRRATDARTSYGAFLDLWRTADPGLPILKAARREAEGLR